jgi:hypothetical protein
LPRFTVTPRTALCMGALVESVGLALLLPSTAQGTALSFCFNVNRV